MDHHVSVVIPAYNASAFLGEAVRSAIEQSRPPLEVLVVDDGSADESRTIAARAGARVLSTGSNSGPASARNAGIAAAQGSLVAFLDADDVWMPNHLETLGGLLGRHPEASVGFSLTRKFGAIDLLPPPAVPADQLLDLSGTLWLLNPVPQSAVLARRTALLDVGGYQQGMRLSEDYDLWFRLARRHRFACSHERTVRYRVHAGQATSGVARILQSAWDVRLRHWNRIAPSVSAAELDSLMESLRQAFDDDMRSAWHYRAAEPLSAMLGVANRPPLAAERIAGTWRWRARYLRRGWLALARIVDLSRKWRSGRGRAAQG